MKEEKGGSVEELADKPESKLVRKEVFAERQESRLARKGISAGKQETRLKRNAETDGLEEIDLEDFREEWIPEEEVRENDWEEDFPEDEEAVPMNPWVMAAAFAGLIVLAAIICAVLWHFTHLDKGEGEQPSQSAAVSSIENSASAGVSPEPADTLAPDAPLSQEPGTVPDTVPAVPSGSAPAASPAAPPESAPALPSSTVPTQGSSQPSSTEPSSGAVQEPVSGTTAMIFTQSVMDVTPKDVVNLRSEPTTTDPDNIVAQVKNGEILHRTGVNQDTGWTRLEYNGEIVYAVSLLMTSDLTYKTPVQAADPNRVAVADGRIILFTDCDDNLTPKEYVNLRTEPSTSQGDATVRCQVSNGEVVHRTGYSPDAGWSRVEYNGEVLYVVSSYMNTVE